jgi:hypothetical protein
MMDGVAEALDAQAVINTSFPVYHQPEGACNISGLLEKYLF